MRYLKSALASLVSRHALDADTEAIDSAIHEQYMKNLTALMFRFKAKDAKAAQATCLSPREQFDFDVFEWMRPLLLQNNGEEVEDILWVFREPADAVQAAIDLRRAVREREEGSSDLGQLMGVGIHTGELLFIEGTDVHWGDPVNTASKLGEDMASDGEIIITADVYAAVNQLAAFEEMSFVETTLKRSKVTFHCYTVQEGYE